MIIFVFLLRLVGIVSLVCAEDSFLAYLYIAMLDEILNLFISIFSIWEIFKCITRELFAHTRVLRYSKFAYALSILHKYRKVC